MTAESPKSPPRCTDTTSSAKWNSLLGEVTETMTRIRSLVDTATRTQLRGPSNLAGWDRAHVFAHICGFSHAVARQMEYGLRKQRVQMYDGGTAGRNADIERRVAGRAELWSEVAAAFSALTATLDAVNVNDRDRAISYRDTSIFGGLQGAWRELSIHLVDLDLGYSPLSWSDALCNHLFDFLEPRVPSGISVALWPDGGSTRRLGDGPQDVDATGRRQDLAAWLSGRATAGPVIFSTGAAPALLPWPARKP